MYDNIWKEFGNQLPDIDKRCTKILSELPALQKQQKAEWEILNKSFDDRQNEYSKRHEGSDPAIEKERCDAQNGLFNKYQADYYARVDNIQHQYYQLWADYINELSFWTYLGSATTVEFKERFSRLATSFLSRINGLAELSRPVFRYCPESKADDKLKEAPDVKEPDCGVNVEIYLVVGKINMNCETFEIELGLKEGFVFNYEKNFKTGTSTLAFGAGMSVPVPEMKVPLSTGGGLPFTGLEIGAKEQFYITFDRDNSIADIGVLWEAEVDIKGMNKPDLKANMKLGLLSGTMEIDEGPLKPIADKIYGVKAETQVNKNVPIYRPK